MEGRSGDLLSFLSTRRKRTGDSCPDHVPLRLPRSTRPHPPFPTVCVGSETRPDPSLNGRTVGTIKSKSFPSLSYSVSSFSVVTIVFDPVSIPHCGTLDPHDDAGTLGSRPPEKCSIGPPPRSTGSVQHNPSTQGPFLTHCSPGVGGGPGRRITDPDPRLG